MKTKIFILIPFIFLACKEIDIEQVAKEDNLSGEKKDYLIACEKYDNAKSCNAIAALIVEEKVLSKIKIKHFYTMKKRATLP